MQTETPQPNMIGSEHLPLPPAQTGDRVPVLPPLEKGIERGAERYEQAAEASAAASDASAFASMPAAVPVVVPPAQDNSQTTQQVGPATAADDDVIEKEWVDKAKVIIQATRDDPHARTSQVGQLQRDYLKKRFGKEVGAA